MSFLPGDYQNRNKEREVARGDHKEAFMDEVKY